MNVGLVFKEQHQTHIHGPLRDAGGRVVAQRRPLKGVNGAYRRVREPDRAVSQATTLTGWRSVVNVSVVGESGTALVTTAGHDIYRRVP